MAAVAFNRVEKRFGGTLALQGFDIEVESGELVTLLGPSGCGKTTALRILAGLIPQSSGSVHIDGNEVSALPTAQRNIGMVFQSYSLFPNLNARKNMEFGLRARKVNSSLIKERVESLMEITGLAQHQAKYPHQLSGGQQQRVALVRALVTQPRVLLLDEPLSALDAQVRVQIREEVRRLQRELGITTIFVTHDQEEAMAISDRVGVMREGKLLQLASPQHLYDSPDNAFVARFFGTVNEIPTRLVTARTVQLWRREVAIAAASGEPDGSPLALIRPESIRIARASHGEKARILSISFLGPITAVEIRPLSPSYPDLHSPEALKVVVPSQQMKDLRVGDEIDFDLDLRSVLITYQSHQS